MTVIRVDDYANLLPLTPEQAVQIARAVARFVTGSYPPDALRLRYYVSLRLDPSYRPASRPSLEHILTRGEMLSIWSRLSRSAKQSLMAPKRYGMESYVRALEDIWVILQNDGIL